MTRDRVTPALRELVLRRDGRCVLSKFDAAHECRDMWARPHASDDLDRLTIEQVVISRLIYESLCKAAERALEPTGEHRTLDGGYCPDCQGQCLRDWLARPPLPPEPSKDRQWDGS